MSVLRRYCAKLTLKSCSVFQIPRQESEVHDRLRQAAGGADESHGIGQGGLQGGAKKLRRGSREKSGGWIFGPLAAPVGEEDARVERKLLPLHSTHVSR